MIRLTLNGAPVLDPLHEAISLRALNQPAPEELDRCNSLMNPLGREPARGWLVLLRGDLLKIGVNNSLTLTVEDDGNRNKVSVAGLTVTKEPTSLAQNVTANAPDSAMLVEVSDSRWLAKHFSECDRQYNVRAPAYGSAASPIIFCEDSLNAGAAWTWQAMVTDLWGLLPTVMGAAPTLPFAPDGTPEGWVFPGVSAWDALCDVLDRIGCMVAWNWATNTYGVVRVGAPDPLTAAALANVARRKTADGEYIPIVRGKEPAAVRVRFHRREIYAGTEETLTRDASAAWQLLHSYAVDVAGGSAGAVAGTVHALWDDLPALYDASGGLANGAALATRAAERAADYYRMLRAGGNRLHHTYSGLLTLAPGPIVKGVAWRQRGATPDGGGGFFTEVVRHPHKAVRADDNARWCECDDSTAVRPPSFGPQWPVYPITDQILRVATALPFDGLYDCTLEKPSGATSLADKDLVWGFDLAGSTQLTAGDYYLCRLTYQAPAGERQRIVVAATGGYWTVTGDATHLAWNETAANVQAVVQAVTGLAVLVTGADGGPYTLAWPDALPHDPLTGDGTHLTGPSPSLTFAEILRGGWRPVLAFNSKPAVFPPPDCPPLTYVTDVSGYVTCPDGSLLPLTLVVTRATYTCP